MTATRLTLGAMSLSSSSHFPLKPVWTNLWSTDKVARYDPGNGQWTLFDLPNRGTEARYIAIAEREGKLEVILPYYRTRKVAVMTFRSEAELTALKAQAERQ